MDGGIANLPPAHLVLDLEELIREAIKDFSREKVFISVKFGTLRNHDGNFIGFDRSSSD
jgi:aryl-alcohol dehydrogenase-like predicted oxidoreductase